MKDRILNFTSSQIYKLMTNGSRPMTKEEKEVFVANGGDKRKKNTFDYGSSFYTYIKEKQREGRAGRQLQQETKYANPLAWGNLCEPFVHELIELDYKLVSKERYQHPKLPWSGMPDGKKNKEVVSDTKCPWTLNSFFDLSDCKTWEQLKEVSPEYYWQLISNSCLSEIPNCEIMVFMPKKYRLEEIRKRSLIEGYYFHKKEDNELPWLDDDSEEEELHRLLWTPPVEEKEFLIERVTKAAELL